MLKRVKRAARDFDWLSFGALVLILAIGVVFLISASYTSGEQGQGRYLGFIKKQLLWIAIGLAAFLLCLAIRYDWFVRQGYTLYFLCILGLVATFFFPGRAHRWIRLGPVSVQPSEFAKVALLLALAKFVTQVKNFTTIHRVLISLAITVTPMVIIILQPDLGTAVLFLPILFIVLFVGGAQPKHLLAIGLLVLATGVVAILMLPKRDYSNNPRSPSAPAASSEKGGGEVPRTDSTISPKDAPISFSR